MSTSYFFIVIDVIVSTIEYLTGDTDDNDDSDGGGSKAKAGGCCGSLVGMFVFIWFICGKFK